MILTVEQLKNEIDCGDMTDDKIKRRLDSIEKVIRKYTHNNFQNPNVRFVALSDGQFLACEPFFIKVGETIQISQSIANNGIYAVTEVRGDGLMIDGDLFIESYNLVTKVEYPADVVECAIKLFEWQRDFGAKIGIKSESESLSRHSESVTYEDSATLFMGYPKGILNGLLLYKKARF